MSNEVKILERVVEKTIDHDAAGRITTVTERHLIPDAPDSKPAPGPDAARLFELECDSALLHVLEGLARRALEVLANPGLVQATRKQPLKLTVGHFGGVATYHEKGLALGKRWAPSALVKLISATTQWPKIDVWLDGPASPADAVARPERAPRITPTRHVGFRAR